MGLLNQEPHSTCSQSPAGFCQCCQYGLSLCGEHGDARLFLAVLVCTSPGLVRWVAAIHPPVCSVVSIEHGNVGMGGEPWVVPRALCG